MKILPKLSTTALAIVILAGSSGLQGSIASASVTEGPVGEGEFAPVTLDNLNLVAGLPASDKCLFDRGVFPSGGVGYADSSLPYDHLDPINAAAMTLRAQLIRANPDAVFDVAASTSGSRISLIVHVKAAPDVVPTLEDLVDGDAAASAAHTALLRQGILTSVQYDAFNSTADICELRDTFHNLRADDGSRVTIYSEPDPRTGQLVITTVPADAREVEEHAAQYGARVSIKVDELETAAGRFSDSPAWYGGDRILSSGGFECSNSFRVGGNTSLTSHHCFGASFSNNGVWMGNRYGDLYGANVDAVLIAGSTYGGRIWMGGGVGNTSSIAANGIFSYGLLSPGAPLLASGSASGQIGITYQGVWQSGGCATFDNQETYCQLLKFTASGNQCIGKDSGGPVGVYDQAGARVIAAGIVTGTTGDRNAVHECVVTNMDAISFLYGNPTIG